MATVQLDRIEFLSASEKYGVLQSLSRRAHISGLEKTGGGVPDDYTILLRALEEAGLPAAGTLLEGTALVLTERKPTVVDKDKVEVDLQYELALNEGQNLDDPPYGLVLGEIRTNLQQVKSNKDEVGALIVVEHTYPAEDPEFGGETKQQTGEIDDTVPQKTFTLSGVKETTTPWLIANAIIGKVNSVNFGTNGTREWLCTSAGWKWYGMEMPGNVHKYLMTFEFQHNPDGWDAVAVFIDSRTGKPPAGLVEGVGYKSIQKKEAVDFAAIIGVTIQGG